MYIDDKYLENLFVSNPTHLNSNTAKKRRLSSMSSDEKFTRITLIQQIYLTILTLVALKVFSASLYR